MPPLRVNHPVTKDCLRSLLARGVVRGKARVVDHGRKAAVGIITVMAGRPNKAIKDGKVHHGVAMVDLGMSLNDGNKIETINLMLEGMIAVPNKLAKSLIHNNET